MKSDDIVLNNVYYNFFYIPAEDMSERLTPLFKKKEFDMPKLNKDNWGEPNVKLDRLYPNLFYVPNGYKDFKLQPLNKRNEAQLPRLNKKDLCEWLENRYKLY